VSAETTSKRNTKHGESKRAGNIEYRIWKGIKSRCYNRNVKKFPDYGGRGITVCDRWVNSFENFLSDMGRMPDGANCIDRIDNSGNYEPSNCRWTNWFVQANNRMDNVVLTAEGKSKTISQWARTKGVSRSLIADRIKLGWDDLSAITTAPKAIHNYKASCSL